MKQEAVKGKGLRKWQMQLHELIYESETAAGKTFDVALLAFILISIIVVMLDSVDALHAKYGAFFYIMEWLPKPVGRVTAPALHVEGKVMITMQNFANIAAENCKIRGN